MKLSALCCTYKRARTLGHLIESFLRQNYPANDRELIILDDAGQYRKQNGDGWTLISIPHRFHSLGEKRNACAALASADSEGFLVADDDDIYLPHWFTSSAESLSRAEWSRPSVVLLQDGEDLRESLTSGLYHGGWAYRRTLFERVGGYRALNNGEDQELAHRFNLANATIDDPCSRQSPFYLYREWNDSYHLSWLGDDGYQSLDNEQTKRSTFRVGWPRDFTKVNTKHIFKTGPVSTSSPVKVELIRPVNAPGRTGPINGMYALQRALRKRIKEDADWLDIRNVPSSPNVIPWFWHWDDRDHAVWWSEQGRPFFQGPNMLFTHSHEPRIDAQECALLDSASCLGMFCHSEWYRDLILANRRETNTSPIHLWPYPIDPMPDGPTDLEYDLLIYNKNGERPGLVEDLETRFSRTITFHYGHYQREKLIQAARRSAACVYLADDDHGPLALQEILLCGCPVVGVPRGAPFVEHGKAGYIIESFPPGEPCFRNATDSKELSQLQTLVASMAAMNRVWVSEQAQKMFDVAYVTEFILNAVSATIR